MSLIYLAEIQGYNLTTNAVETLRFCHGRGFTDLSGNFYAPRISQPALISRTIFDGGNIGGAQQKSYGEMALANIDGGLDYFSGYTFDGRDFKLLVGDESAAYSSFTPIIVSSIANVSIGYEFISIRLTDKTKALDVAVQPLIYAGNSDVEGGPDLKGKRKPLFFGQCRNVTGVQVSATKLIYQFSSGAMLFAYIRDKGMPLSFQDVYASKAAMLADTSILPGHFKVWLDESLFRLGSSPAGVITGDLASTSTPLASAANIIAALITGIGISMYSPDYSALETANNKPLGISITGEMTVEEVINLVCGSVGAWYGFDNLNQFRVKILDFPGVTYSASIDEFDILNIEQEQIGPNSTNSPVWRYALNCVKNWTVQTIDTLAGGVSDADRAFYAEEWRTEEQSDSGIKTKHLSAQDITSDSYFASATDASAEALRRLNLLKVRSVLIKATVIINPANAAAFEVGSDIKVTHKRFGLQSGKILKIISATADYRKGQIELGLGINQKAYEILEIV